jgi:hypothetical protein
MVFKISGFDSKKLPPSAYGKNYAFKLFGQTTRITQQRWVKIKGEKWCVSEAHNEHDVRQAIQKVWLGVVNRSKICGCNDYFKSLPMKKTLAEILVDGDFMVYRLALNDGHFDTTSLPHACIIGRDIGIDVNMLFEDDPQEVICTMIHELAHVGGALTDKISYVDPELPLAAEKALPKCNCNKHYQEGTLGMINVRSGGKLASRVT